MAISKFENDFGFVKLEIYVSDSRFCPVIRSIFLWKKNHKKDAAATGASLLHSVSEFVISGG